MSQGSSNACRRPKSGRRLGFVPTIVQCGHLIVSYRQRNRLVRPTDATAAPEDRAVRPATATAYLAGSTGVARRCVAEASRWTRYDPEMVSVEPWIGRREPPSVRSRPRDRVTRINGRDPRTNEPAPASHGSQRSATECSFTTMHPTPATRRSCNRDQPDGRLERLIVQPRPNHRLGARRPSFALGQPIAPLDPSIVPRPPRELGAVTNAPHRATDDLHPIPDHRAVARAQQAIESPSFASEQSEFQ